jgi:2-oxoglutarate ferredoxin oxidoreductase subunit alpha
MTKNELKQYNGQNGAKAYVAYKGKVYDVTQSSFWKGGEHAGMHSAGEDLTSMMASAPHGGEVFSKFEIVATLEEEKEKAPSKEDASRSEEPFKEQMKVWYQKYHPHPMLVHFPIALHIFAAGLDLMFLTVPNEAYAVGVFYTFFVATVMGFFAMIPGILSWWINYNLSTRRPFIVKLVVATLTLLLGVVGIVLYLENPGIVYETSWEGITYHFIVLFSGVCVIVLGYYGGKIIWGKLSEYPAQTPHEAKKEFSSGTEKLSGADTYNVPFLSAATIESVQRVQHVSKSIGVGEHNSVSILIGGAAGRGLDTLEKILGDAIKRSGYYFFSTKEYMSRVRGGSNTVLIRISDAPIEAPCWKVDLFMAIDAPALEHAKERCTDKTVILADESFVEKNTGITGVAMNSTAKELGDLRYANVYAAGLIFAVFGIEQQALLQSVAEHFENDETNEKAVKAGLQAGAKLDSSRLPVLPEVRKETVEKLHLMDGTTASGFGFLAGGCNFVTSYPMSPSTGVLNFMASMSKEFTIALEQSEDEIASLHMVLGAWYAGARALTTTSGGGFALMGEALSLSGMTETPAVIYLAQRPGPATGLPTRSEQGDLNLALHSGHGPFTRVILAPGSLQECIDYGYLAFELADRYQVPVIVLSDQYLADTMTMIEQVEFSAYEQRRYILPTDEAYQRYADTEDGISPRGVPGFGEGLVCADGHEHDERGQITEDYRVRIQMVSKRARKEKRLVSEAIAPESYAEGSIALVGWGSTRGALAEALRRLDDPRLAQVHFAWIHPLNPEHLAFLKAYSHVIVVENNADGAFADKLALHGISIDSRILQFNGFAFFSDQLAEMISKSVKELS